MSKSGEILVVDPTSIDWRSTKTFGEHFLTDFPKPQSSTISLSKPIFMNKYRRTLIIGY
jgi:hypothetical protein